MNILKKMYVNFLRSFESMVEMSKYKTKVFDECGVMFDDEMQYFYIWNRIESLKSEAQGKEQECQKKY